MGDTSVSATNSWVDEFDHGLSFSTFVGTKYQTFENLGPGQVAQSVHWRHNDHWMVDLTSQARESSAAMLSPDQSFRFEDGQLVLEADTAAGLVDYESVHGAWPELLITTADAPADEGRSGAIYGYEYFPGHFTLGCRLEPGGNIICSLMDDTRRDDLDGGRDLGKCPSSSTWEPMSSAEGDLAMASERFGSAGKATRIPNAEIDSGWN